MYGIRGTRRRTMPRGNVKNGDVLSRGDVPRDDALCLEATYLEAESPKRTIVRLADVTLATLALTHIMGQYSSKKMRTWALPLFTSTRKNMKNMNTAQAVYF